MQLSKLSSSALFLGFCDLVRRFCFSFLASASCCAAAAAFACTRSLTCVGVSLLPANLRAISRLVMYLGLGGIPLNDCDAHIHALSAG